MLLTGQLDAKEDMDSVFTFFTFNSKETGMLACILFTSVYDAVDLPSLSNYVFLHVRGSKSHWTQLAAE